VRVRLTLVRMRAERVPGELPWRLKGKARRRAPGQSIHYGPASR
jgi:hypothetical protein